MNTLLLSIFGRSNHRGSLDYSLISLDWVSGDQSVMINKTQKSAVINVTLLGKQSKTHKKERQKKNSVGGM